MTTVGVIVVSSRTSGFAKSPVRFTPRKTNKAPETHNMCSSGTAISPGHKKDSKVCAYALLKLECHPYEVPVTAHIFQDGTHPN